MPKNIFLILCTVIVFLISSCSGVITECAPVDYLNWIDNPENNLIVETKAQVYTFSLQYRPVSYLALLEAGSADITSEIIDSLEHSLAGQQQFLFHVALNDGNNDWLNSSTNRFNDYEEQIKYLSFSMQNDFKLVRHNDTLDCAIFHFERDYGIRPFGTFLLGFPCDEVQNVSGDTVNFIYSIKVIYTDSSFGDEIIEFPFSYSDLNKIPTLKL
ncbi:MAG: hypothetical protein QM503_00055 [Bacteroidota bacterium]